MLGDIVKRIRIEKGLTIKAVAEKANVTISLLSQIENSKANPSIKSLIAIARALDVHISTFFDDAEMDTSPVIKSYKRKMIRVSKGVSYYLLSPALKELSMEFKYMVYERKGCTTGHFHVHEGEECGLVLEGRLEVIHDGHTYILEAGDSIYLDSSKPHAMKNIYDGRTVAVWADSPPPSETYI